MGWDLSSVARDLYQEALNTSYGTRGMGMKWLALLRGLNVGGNNMLSMAQLRTHLIDLGLKNVKTQLATGTVIFETDGQLRHRSARRSGSPKLWMGRLIKLATVMRERVGERTGPDADTGADYIVFAREAADKPGDEVVHGQVGAEAETEISKDQEFAGDVQHFGIFARVGVDDASRGLDNDTHLSGGAHIRSLLPDVSRLANLSEQLLDLHRLDNGAPSDRIDLAILARSVAADLAPVLIASGKAIEVVVDEPGMVIGDAGSIGRALTNLIQNAVDHGGDEVIVRIDGATVEVRDNGPGIPTEEHERVFEPFHRLRPRSSGTGLGLNLVKQVVDHHRGRITLAKAPGGGAIVRVEFRAVQ